SEPASKTEPASKLKSKSKTKPKSEKAARSTSAASPAPSQKPAVHVAPAPRSESATSAWIASAMKQDAAASSKDEPQAAGRPAEKAKSDSVSTPEQDPEPSETALAQKPVTPRPEVELSSKRLGDQLGQSSRESADLLTADRLLDPHQLTKPEPEGAWSHFLYTISGRLINIG